MKDLRGSYRLEIPRMNAVMKHWLRSFRHSAAKIWNDLNESVRTLGSLNLKMVYVF